MKTATVFISYLLYIATTCHAGNSGKYLFILSGQSNMQGMDQRLSFEPRVVEAFGRENVLIVKEAIGGRPIRMWVHDWASAPDWKIDPNIPNTKPPLPEENGVMYDSMMSKVTEATQGIAPKAVVFCWMQGERDARERHASVYEPSLKKLFDQLQADFPNTPLVYVIGKLSDFGVGNKEAFYPEWDEIRLAQEKVALATPFCSIFSTDDLNTGDSPPHWKTGKVSQRVDDLHMSAEGYKIMGERFANEAIKLLKVVTSPVEENDGTAPEVTDLNAKDVSYAKEKDLPYLKKAFVNTSPKKRNDGIPVGELDSVAETAILQFANEIIKGDHGDVDSLLIAKNGTLVFESYYRRGRINYPHYQMSITKSYTAMAIGRAIQLGYLAMADLDKPLVDFLIDIDRAGLAPGTDKITLDQAMNMRSGIRIDKAEARQLMKQPGQLRGQRQVQAYLTLTAPISDPPRDFKYQASDPTMVMQVLECVVPGSAQEFIKTELLTKMGIDNYHWDTDVSGFPKAAAGSSMCSRDMLKWGLLVMNDGRWNGEQLIPIDYVRRATSYIHKGNHSNYGFFWWGEDVEVKGKKYAIKSGRGAGGQFILMIPQCNLIAVVTAHNKGMGKMRHTIPERIIPAMMK